MKEVLKKFGFVAATTPNEMRKDRYIAIIWGSDNAATICQYSPKVKRLLSSKTLESKQELLNELTKNHQ